MFIALTILAELFFVAILILLFFKFKNRLGYAPLYVLLGSYQYLQTILASSVKLHFFGGLSIAAGASILFSSGLFAILLMYIKEGVKSTQHLILAIVLANLSFTVISIITNEQELLTNGVVSGMFSLHLRIFAVGTLALILDAFLLIIIYEFFFSRIKRLNLYFRLVLALLITLIFDAVFFIMGSFWDDPEVVTILLGQIVGKSVAALFFGSVLFLYLRYFDNDTNELNNKNEKGKEDIFSILYYKGRYEKLKTEKATSDEQLKKAIDEKAIELERSVRRFTILSGIRELRMDKFSFSDQAYEILLKVKEAFAVDACTIHLIKNNVLELFSSVGIPENEKEKILPITIHYFNDIIAEKRSLAIEDLRTDKKHAVNNEVRNTAFEYISCLGSPMLYGKEVIGILTIYVVTEKRVFTNLEKEHVQMEANQIAYSRVNVSLFEQNEKHKEVLVKQIVARKKVEEAIRKSNERFELIGKAANDALWEWNLETDQLWANEAHQQLYGYTMADPVPDDNIWRQNLHENDRQRVLDSLDRILASDGNIWDGEYRLHTAKKGWINIFGRTYIERNPEGKPIRLLGSMMDITDRKKYEETLKKSERNLRQVLTSISDIFYVIDKNFRITLLNKTANELLSKAWGSNVIIGKNILELIPADGDEPVRESFEKVFTGKSVEYEHHRSSKEIEGWFLVNYHPVLSDEGNITGAYVVTKDITERKKAQAQVSSYNLQLRDLAAHLLSIREEERRRIGREIHDDLGQQLTAIKMDVAWIDKKITDDEIAVKNKLKNIIGLLDGSNQSVRRILNELKPSILDEYGLLDALEWHCKLFTESTGIPVTIKTVESEIRLDEETATCIFRVCQEALTNVARHAEAKKVIILLELVDFRIYVQVKDDGKGFELANAHNKGSFGLLGMHERVRSLNGILNINSSINIGTTIDFSLPYINQKINKLT